MCQNSWIVISMYCILNLGNSSLYHRLLVFSLLSSLVFLFKTTYMHKNNALVAFNFPSTTTSRSNVEKQSLDMAKTDLAKQNFTYPFCGKYASIYYIKIHKTGSSTFQNILYRIGLRRHLMFAMFHCNYEFTYPHPPLKTYLYQDPTLENFSMYHMLVDHSKFDPHVYKEYLQSPTYTVTFLRHPLTQFRSAFKYWHIGKLMGIPATENHTNVEEFILHSSKYEELQPSFGCLPQVNISLTRNPQAHHLGLTNQNTADEDEINAFVKYVDNQVNMVLILERFEESLILLKRSLCLHIKDAVYISQLKRLKGIYNPENKQELELLHRDWSKADYALYDYFFCKFDHTIKSSSPDFQQEVELFKDLENQVTQFCKSSCTRISLTNLKDMRRELQEGVWFEKTPFWNEFELKVSDCLLMMMKTYTYHDAIKAIQWPEACQKVANTQNKLPNILPEFCKPNSELSYANWEELLCYKQGGAYLKEISCL